MNKLIIGTLATLVLGAGSALAADMPIKAPPPAVQVWTWTGCYVGINGGWARERDRGYAADGTFLHDVNGDGGVFGGQVGCDYQMSQFVFGIEAMWDWAGLNNTGTDPALAGGVP